MDRKQRASHRADAALRGATEWRSAPWNSRVGLARARVLVVAAGILVAACQPAPPEPSRPTPKPTDSTVAPLVTAPPAAIALPSMALPSGPIYACAAGGERTPIAFPDNVEALCRRHPEMGPCQYERDACRRRGGRVYTSNGEEVTLAVEAEYDRKVRRVRFQADGAPAKK